MARIALEKPDISLKGRIVEVNILDEVVGNDVIEFMRNNPWRPMSLGLRANIAVGISMPRTEICHVSL
jgi:hypothetical protein